MHGVVAFVVASPILIYNIGQNFEPLRFQWQHAAQKSPVAWRSLLDFVGVQVLLFGTLPFFLLPWVLFNWRRLCQDARLRVCTTMYAIPVLFFLYKSTQTRLEGNWALVCFVAIWPLAAAWFDTVSGSKWWRWLTVSGFLPPVIAVMLIGIHLICPLTVIPPQLDRVYRQVAIHSATRDIADRIREAGQKTPVFADSYQMTAWLRFQSLPAQQEFGLSSRPSHFTRPPHRLTDVDQAFVVTQNEMPGELTEGFGPPELVTSVPVIIRGETIGMLNVRRYTKLPQKRDKPATLEKPEPNDVGRE